MFSRTWKSGQVWNRQKCQKPIFLRPKSCLSLAQRNPQSVRRISLSPEFRPRSIQKQIIQRNKGFTDQKPEINSYNFLFLSWYWQVIFEKIMQSFFIIIVMALIIEQGIYNHNIAYWIFSILTSLSNRFHLFLKVVHFRLKTSVLKKIW